MYTLEEGPGNLQGLHWRIFSHLHWKTILHGSVWNVKDKLWLPCSGLCVQGYLYSKQDWKTVSIQSRGQVCLPVLVNFFFISLQPIRKDLCSLNSMFLNYDANPLQAQHPSGLLYLSPSTKQLAKTADGNMMIMLALL